MKSYSVVMTSPIAALMKCIVPLIVSTRTARGSRFEDRTAEGGAIIIVDTNNLIGKWKARLDA